MKKPISGQFVELAGALGSASPIISELLNGLVLIVASGLEPRKFEILAEFKLLAPLVFVCDTPPAGCKLVPVPVLAGPSWLAPTPPVCPVSLAPLAWPRPLESAVLAACKSAALAVAPMPPAASTSTLAATATPKPNFFISFIIAVMADSIFTKIVKGEIPCYKIYEDERTLAFLDIHPITDGHTLVIPKKQVEFVWDLAPEDYQALMASAQKVAKHLREKTGQPLVGSQIIGVDVPHAHIHLIPFSDVTDFHRVADQSLAPDHERLAALAKQLAMN